LRQHHQQQDNGYRKPQQEQPGWGNGPPQHSDMFRQTPAEVNPLKDLSGWNPVPIRQTEPPCQVASGRFSVVAFRRLQAFERPRKNVAACP
jgi:hypothetical protein